MTYMRHIDGLRAIAVLSVILFHADARLVPGGYLGVDIFFVISGFLITSLISDDMDKGRFSLARFYERRARRILPVLFLVLAMTTPFAVFLLLPSQQTDFARSVAATVLFASNIQFWMETGYFMVEAELKPLLHTWSLAVEEQFYLLYPLLLMTVWRSGVRARVASLGLVFLVSLMVAVVLSERAPGANFYLLPSRAWELMAGALLALAPRAFQPNRWVAEILGLLGLVLIAAALAGFNETTPMPSLWGLIPIGGAVLVIAFARAETLMGRLLGLPALVFIGKISFSAYLWHWPILVFARVQYGATLEAGLLAALIGLTLTLSVFSWWLVEQPFRRRGNASIIRTGPLVLGLAVAAVALAGLTNLPYIRVFGTAALAADAADLTSPAGIEAAIATNYGLSESCEGAFTLNPACRTSDTPEVLLWGDSFAMHLAPAISAGVGARGMIQHTKSVCAPIVDISVVTTEYPAAWSEGCIVFNDNVLDWLSNQPSIRYVVISSPFGLVFNDVYLRGGEVLSAPRPDIVHEKLLETAARIRAMDKIMIIVSPPPVTGEDIGQCLARTALAGGPEDACDFTTTEIDRLSELVRTFLVDIAASVPVLFLHDLICAKGICDTRIGDIFMFRDKGHLSIAASRYLGEQRAFYQRIEALAQSVN